MSIIHLMFLVMIFIVILFGSDVLPNFNLIP